MVHRVTCALLSVSGVLLCRDTAKDAELLALRREKAMARRQLGGPVRYEPTDQFWLAARSSPIPRCDWSRVFPVPGDIAGLARRPIAKRWDYSVWFTTEPDAISWYRVVEVNLPLYQDEQGMEQLDLAGMRLACLEAGVASERIVPTRQTYQVGHYVTLHSSAEAAGAIWVRDRVGGSLRKVWDSGLLFDGQPIAPAHPQQLMHISMEPARMLLRRGEKAPLRVLAHYTDGTATWTERLESPEVLIRSQVQRLRPVDRTGRAVPGVDLRAGRYRCPAPPGQRLLGSTHAPSRAQPPAGCAADRKARSRATASSATRCGGAISA